MPAKTDNAAGQTITAANLNALGTEVNGKETAGAAAAAQAAAVQRANHTGTQAASTISDFNSATRAQVEAELVAGTNITITPGSGDATRTLTIASTASGGGSSGVSAVSFLPTPQAGHYFGSPLITGGNANSSIGTGRLFFVPFIIPEAMTLAGVVVEAGAAVTSATARLGLYAAGTDGRPTDLLIDAGVVDCSTTGSKEATISQAVPAGLLFVAVVGQTAAPTLRATNAAHQWVVPAATASTFTLNSTTVRLAQLGQTGALPAIAAVVVETGSTGGGLPIPVLKRA